MKIEQLRYVIETANLGSINKASEKMYVAQSTISLSIKQLEDELGFKIFERSNNGTTLTGYGECFYNKAKKVVYLFDDLHTINTNDSEDILKISSYPYTAVSKTYAEFLEKNICQETILRENCSISLCLQDVYSGKSDLAFIGYITENESHLNDYLQQYSLLFTPIIFGDQMYAYMGVHNGMYENETEIHADELKMFTRFRLEDKNDSLKMLLDSREIPECKSIYTHSLHNLLEIEKNVKGFAIGIDSRFKNSNPDSGIRRIRIKDVNLEFLFGYVIRRDWAVTNSARAFINLLAMNTK